MAIVNNLPRFGYSFSDGFITIGTTIFEAVSSIRLNQTVEEAAIFGTARGPLGRTGGHLNLGVGSIRFSSLDGGMDFWHMLEPNPLFTTFNIDYTLAREDGSMRSFEAFDCRLLNVGVDTRVGPDAIQQDYNFSFLSMKVDRIGTALSPFQFISTVASLAGQVRKFL